MRIICLLWVPIWLRVNLDHDDDSLRSLQCDRERHRRKANDHQRGTIAHIRYLALRSCMDYRAYVWLEQV